MSKAAKRVGAIVVLLIAAALAAPYLVGLQIERSFRDRIETFAAESDIPLQFISYQRGWFDAHAKTVAFIGDHRVALNHIVHHGPWPDFDWGLVESQPVFDASPQLKALYHQPPLTITTRFGFSGGYTGEINSPAVTGVLATGEDGPIKIDWGGLSGTLEKAGGQGVFKMNAPGLAWAANGVQVTMEGLQIHGSGSDMHNLGVADATVDWDSNSTASIDRIAVSDALGGSEMSLGLAIQAALSSPLADALDYTARMEITDLHAAGLDDDPASAPINMDSAALAISLTGMKASAVADMAVEWKQFQQQITQTGDIGRAQAEQQMKLITLAYLPRIFAGTPEFTLEIPAVNTSHGAFGMQFKAALTPASSAASAPPAPPAVQLLQRTVLEAKAFGDSQLVRWLIGKSENSSQVRATLERLAAQNLLAIGNDRVGATAYFDADKFLINGRPAPPGFTQTLMAGLAE